MDFKLATMVKHIVFFKLPQSTPNETRRLKLKLLEEIFSPLGKKLDYIIDFKTGININMADHAWDFVIDSIFSNRYDLQKYQESPEHKEAVLRGSEIEKSKAVIDYEY